MESIYLIVDTNNGDVLLDNITFDELAELYPIYSDFYGEQNICPCITSVKTVAHKRLTERELFVSAWMCYMDMLYELDNIMH